MRTLHRPLTVVVCLLAVGVLAAQDFKTGTPESVGMSAERLARIRPAMQAFVDAKEVPAIETLVARRGVVVHNERIGMERGAIYRLASMTKPVTSVAIMMLVEEGKILLSDPVSRFIPAFKEMRVVAPAPTSNGSGNGAGDGAQETGNEGTVPAKRPITIEDLLTHRAGLIYPGFDQSPLGKMYEKAGIYPGLGPNAPASMAANIDKLASLPLKFQPGTAWQYGLSTDVLGRVVEVASEMSLEEFFRRRIFEPLAMRDTHFNLPSGKASRLVAIFALDKGVLTRAADQGSPVGLTYFSGGGGLVGTTYDYLRFSQMLMNGGELDGVRLLGRKTVELMTASHTTDLNRGAARPGYGFGYGLDVREWVGGSHRAGSEGAFGWSGAYGTYFWIDPKEQLITMLMHQLWPRDGRSAERFQIMAYAAILD
jgi:CubicO group peptidase (beta-lactamase class C family)